MPAWQRVVGRSRLRVLHLVADGASLCGIVGPWTDPDPLMTGQRCNRCTDLLSVGRYNGARRAPRPSPSHERTR